VQNLDIPQIIKEKAADGQKVAGFFPNKLRTEDDLYQVNYYKITIWKFIHWLRIYKGYRHIHFKGKK
jgi:hypothetical protein